MEADSSLNGVAVRCVVVGYELTAEWWGSVLLYGELKLTTGDVASK